MRTEVAIVGAGIIGCSLAHELARRGRSVTIVDPRAEGEGATHASGGMLVPYVEAHGSGPMLELGVRSLAMYDQFVRDVSDERHHVEYSRAGSLQVSLGEEGTERLRQEGDVLRGASVEVEWLDAAQLPRLEPRLSTEAHAGLLIRPHGLVAAAALNRALWRAAERRGARRLTARVRRVAPASGTVGVETTQGMLTADRVAICGGSWSADIEVEGEAPVPVQPMRGQLLVLKWPGAPLERIVWGPRCYLVPWRNGTLLVGATLEDVGFDERTTVAGVHDLLDAAAELVPDAWRAEFLGARVGLRPATPDGLPILGRSAAIPHVFYATGHFRNGVLLAPVTAKLLSDAIAENREDSVLAAFSPSRFGGRDGQAHSR
jgi:glycine oxidase